MSCRGCTRRCMGCHGKNEDGTWRCRDWGIEQERKAAEREETLHKRIASSVIHGYAVESICRYRRKRKNGHLGE